MIRRAMTRVEKTRIDDDFVFCLKSNERFRKKDTDTLIGFFFSVFPSMISKTDLMNTKTKHHSEENEKFLKQRE